MPYAITGLLSQMEDVKRRMQGPLAPPPGAFQLPQESAAASPSPASPLMEPTPPPPAPPVARGGLMGKINNLGRPTLPPEVSALLTPEQQQRATGGGLLQRVGLQVLGGGMFTPAMQARWKADRILGDQEARDTAMEAAKMKRARSEIAADYTTMPSDPAQRYAALTEMTGRLAAIGHPDAAKYANILNAIKPDQVRPEAAPKPPTYRPVQRDDGTWTTIDTATGLDPQGNPVQGMRQKDPYYQRPAKQLVQIPKADGTVEFRWLSEGETAIGEKAPPKDIKIINSERSLAYDDAQLSIRGLTDEKGNVKAPPSSWDRFATQSNWTNWAATGDGQAYMNNTRKLIRAWVVLIEGKRMSDADAAVNEAMRSFRPGDKDAVVDNKRTTLSNMAESIGKLGGKKAALLPDPTAKPEADVSEEDLVRAYKALGTRATDSEVDSWITKNPRNP